MTLTEFALAVAERYPVFPCSAEKQPVVKGGFKAATRDPDEIKRMFALPGAALIGVPTGAASGLLVVDVDPAGEGWLDLQRLVLPPTREHKTQRGTHLLFAMPPEPIGCSTSRLAPGVDIRAEGGYIIWWAAAGKAFKSGALAPVPNDILAALRGRPIHEVEGEGVPSRLDPMSDNYREKTNVPPEGGRRLLDSLDPDTDYDTWYKIGAAFEHEYGDAGLAMWREWSQRGKKYPGDEALTEKWASFGRYEGGKPITLRYVLGLVKAQTAEAPLPPATATGPFRITSAINLTNQKPPGWIVRDLLPAADLGMLFAVGGAGKTFFALDVAMHIACGLDWNGKTVKQRRVLYVCAEGAGGFGIRVEAAMQANPNLRVGMHAPNTVFEVLQGAPNFLDAKHVDALVEQAKLMGGFDFVVVDTVAQVTPGGNENSGEDMGRMIGNCRKFNAAFGAFVWLLHHPGKDATKGARGWSGMFGALDVELEITRNGDDRLVRVTKQKEGVDGERFGFRLAPQPVAGKLDADGFEIVSCRVEMIAGDLSKNDKPRRKDGPVEALIMRHAADLAGVGGGAVDMEVLYKAVREGMTHDPARRDQRRSRFNTAVERLGNEARLIIKGDVLELAP